MALGENGSKTKNNLISGVSVKVKKRTENEALIFVTTQVVSNMAALLYTAILDKIGKLNASDEIEIPKSGEYTQVFTLSKPKQGTPETPYLYKVVTVLKDTIKGEKCGDDILDDLETEFKI